MSLLVHKKYGNCVNDGLDIFSPPPRQTSNQYVFLVEVQPFATLTILDAIDFEVSSGGAQYIDLFTIYLNVTASVRNQNRTVLADGVEMPL